MTIKTRLQRLVKAQGKERDEQREMLQRFLIALFISMNSRQR